MKRCPRGHNFDTEKLGLACPFCEAVQRALVLKTIIFSLLALAVVVYGCMRVGGGAVVLSLGTVIVWAPGWLGALVATLGNRQFVGWSLLGYLIGGVFLKLPAGAVAYQTLLDLLKFLDQPNLADLKQTSGWWAIGFTEGLALGLTAIVIETFARRATNEPHSPDARWFVPTPKSD